MRFRISLLALALLATGAVAAAASGETRSTGNTTTHVVPGDKAPADHGATAPAAAPAEVKPQAAVRIELAATEKAKTIEGKTSQAGPAEVLWSAPTEGEMLNARVSSPGNGARLSVFQPGSDKPEAGTAAEDGAIAWTGEIAKAGDLRFEVATKSATEIPFRITVTVTPHEQTQPKKPAQPAAPAPPAKPEKH